jgi:hypothetical protein
MDIGMIEDGREMTVSIGELRARLEVDALI